MSAAIQAQRALTAADFSATEGLRVRMAVHACPVEARGGDYFGPGLNRAARLLLVANGGQVLISGTVADLLQGRLPTEASLFDLGRHRFRDLAGGRAGLPTCRAGDCRRVSTSPLAGKEGSAPTSSPDAPGWSRDRNIRDHLAARTIPPADTHRSRRRGKNTARDRRRLSAAGKLSGWHLVHRTRTIGRPTPRGGTDMQRPGAG